MLIDWVDSVCRRGVVKRVYYPRVHYQKANQEGVYD